MQFEAFDQRPGVLHVAPNTVCVALVALRFLASVFGTSCFFELACFVFHVQGGFACGTLVLRFPALLCCISRCTDA